MDDPVIASVGAFAAPVFPQAYAVIPARTGMRM